MITVLALASCLLLVLLPLSAPFLARTILGARPLEAGPLRLRLEALAGRAGGAVGEILVRKGGRAGRTPGRLLGPGGRRSAVLLSKGLVEGDPRRTEAVFAHELGHARRNHPLYAVLYHSAFLLAFPAMEIGARGAAFRIGEPALAWAALLGAALAWLLTWFGWIARRFEREADEEAMKILSGTAGLLIHR